MRPAAVLMAGQAISRPSAATEAVEQRLRGQGVDRTSLVVEAALLLSLLVALGVLPEGDVGEFEVPQGLLDEGYRIVDISVEPDDGDPTHSGDSIVRGALDFA